MALDFIKNIFGKKNDEDINMQEDFMNYPPAGPGNFPPAPYPNEPLPPPPLPPPVQNQNPFQQNQFPGQLNPQAYLPNFPQNYGYNNQNTNQADYNAIQMLNTKLDTIATKLDNIIALLNNLLQYFQYYRR
jgi:hypothetical protein